MTPSFYPFGWAFPTIGGMPCNSKRANERQSSERLKRGGGGNYFEELLARLRDIRSSEKVFWRKVLDIYATSIDYDPREAASQRFFATVQNKMHWAAHGHTAAESLRHQLPAETVAEHRHVGIDARTDQFQRRRGVAWSARVFAVLAEEHYPAGGVLEDIRHGLAQVELTEPPLVGQPHHDQVRSPLDRFVDQRRPRVTGLHELRLNIELRLRRQLLDLVEDLLPPLHDLVEDRAQR